MKFFVAVTALLALSVSAQQQCCNSAPQPVVIQLSCNGNQAQPAPQPAAPAPAPEAPANATSPQEPGSEPPAMPPSPPPSNPEPELSISEDPDRLKCKSTPLSMGERVYNVLISTDLPGGIPKDFTYYPNNFTSNENDITVEFNGDFARPPNNWDGRPSTLGFPMPAKGTTHYNMLLCWPYPGTHYDFSKPSTG